MMLVVTAAGCVFFPGLFLLSTRTLAHLMGWSHQEAAVVSTRLVSAVQAAMASVVGCVIVASCRDVVMDSHWLTNAYIFFATPYFAYDIYAMFLCSRYRLQVKGHDGQVIRGQGGAEVPPVSSGGAVGTFLRQELLLVLHHVFVVTFCFPASVVWRRGQGDFFQGLLFLAELSTPSVCLGKVLLQCCVKASSPVSTGGRCCSVFVSQFQKQNSLLYRLNGAALLLTFFCCRVLLFPFLYYSYSRYASISLLSVPLVAPWQCNLGMALLWPLQLYWFALLCRKALRQPTASKSTHAD